MPLDFAKALVDKLKTGVELMVRSEYPARRAALPKKLPTHVNSDANQANKRQRHDT
jgi:hypothetical protein